VFTTAEDNQPSVEVHVLQGEREMAMYNKTLGKFQLVDLPPARGRAADRGHLRHRRQRHRPRLGQGPGDGKEQSMTITGQSSLAKDDIERMVKDASPTRPTTGSARRRPRSATTPTRSSTRPRSC